MIKLTEDEKVILKNINKDYKWIARDLDGQLFVYSDKPIKGATCWGRYTYTYASPLYVYSHLFTCIKWEDEEPYLIEDLLKEDDYDDYDEEEDGIPFDDEKWEE